MRSKALSVVVALVATFVVLPRPDAVAAPKPTVTTPAAWDPTIEPLATTVARLRGLEWKHPVAVEFLDDAAFDARLQQGSELDSETRAALEGELKVLRALGLAPGIATVDDLFGTPDTSLVLAYYDPDTQRITVRGTTLDVAHRVTLVHELTHALDDQNFDLDKVAGSATSSAALGRDELIEGDASHVEQLYERELDADDQAALEEQVAAQGAVASNGAVSYTPDFLIALQDAPYLLGPTMVATLSGTQGPQSIDTAFRTPPSDDEAGFNPFVAAYPHPREKVPAPELAKGERKLEKATELGPLSLYLLLASRIDRVQALRAVDGWAGDSMVTLERKQQVCVRDTVAGHTRADTRRLGAALRRFAAALPAGAASVTSTRDTATLTACDAGARVKPPSAYARAALTQLELRNDMASGALTSGVGRADAQCATDAITDDAFFRRLVATTGDLTDQERAAARTRYHDLLERCLDR